MCVIFSCPTTRPDRELILAGAESNPDGGGVAWLEKGTVKWKKGMNGDEVADLVKDIPLPLLIHFRIATVGGDSPQLTHPFPLTKSVSVDLEGSAEAVLMHNGHWGEWREELKRALYASNAHLPGGKWSDTRALAYIVARHGAGMIPFLLNGDRVAILGKGQKIPFRWGLGWIDKEGFSQSCTVSRKRIYNTSDSDVDYYHSWASSNQAIETGKKETPKETPSFSSESGTGRIPAAQRWVECSPTAFSREDVVKVLTVLHSGDKAVGTC